MVMTKANYSTDAAISIIKMINTAIGDMVSITKSGSS